MSFAARSVPRGFYNRDTLTVAPELLGKLLVRRVDDDGGVLIGRIVETEAYRGVDDPASHSYRGRTLRNFVMFGRPGLAYVYFTYGNHYCLNVVTEEEGTPAAVLIRAVEPIEGVEVMKRNRGVENLIDVASGPGKLTKAFQITREQNGCDLTDRASELKIGQPNDAGDKPLSIVQTTRIGIRLAQEKPWRFYIRGNPHVSRK
jgi:DNA-3-methyladenine glycosylase